MEFNAADIFEGVVDRVPEREAVVYGSTRLTYKELDARSNKAANALKKLGIKKAQDASFQDNRPIQAKAVAEKNPNDPNTWGRVSRNAPCPCGSGKKYKHCHG